MTTLTVQGRPPRGLRGTLRVPGDKSISHRALLLGARAEGTSRVTGLSDGDDVGRTAAAVAAMGAAVEDAGGGAVVVTGGRLHDPGSRLDVGNSGTAMRLLAGFCAPFPWATVLVGDDSVSRRPMERVAEPLRAMGAVVDAEYPPLRVQGGRLRGIDYQVPVPSAQVKSAVLLAGLGAQGETVVREREPTRAHTEEMLAAIGADVEVSPGVVRLRPSALRPFELAVPGDPSQAAFWVVAALVVPGSDLAVEGVYTGPARTAFLDVLARMGASLEVDHGRIRARWSPGMHGTDVAGEEVPGLIDEIPILAVAAALAEGASRFTGAAELRVKESDRIATTTAMLGALGATAEALPDGMVVLGHQGAGLQGGSVATAGDHRIAMAGAVAGLAAEGVTRIEGWESVATSYPRFEEDLRSCVS